MIYLGLIYILKGKNFKILSKNTLDWLRDFCTLITQLSLQVFTFKFNK